jgi:hypothetical protein
VRWVLDGTELITGSLDSASSSNMAFYGGSVLIGFNQTAQPGTYGCTEIELTAVFSVDTEDTPQSDFSALPGQWRNLLILRCDAGLLNDTVDATVRVDRADDRFAGVFEMTITGADERVGETLVVSGDFDVDF